MTIDAAPAPALAVLLEALLLAQVAVTDGSTDSMAVAAVILAEVACCVFVTCSHQSALRWSLGLTVVLLHSSHHHHQEW
jgi:hypothetical protein